MAVYVFRAGMFKFILHVTRGMASVRDGAGRERERRGGARSTSAGNGDGNKTGGKPV